MYVYLQRNSWSWAWGGWVQVFLCFWLNTIHSVLPRILRGSGGFLRGYCIFSWGFLFSRHLVASSCCGVFQAVSISTPCILGFILWLPYSRGLCVFQMCYPHRVRPTSKVQSVKRGDWLDVKPKGKGGVKLGQWRTKYCCALIRGTEEQKNEFGMECVQRAFGSQVHRNMDLELRKEDRP